MIKIAIPSMEVEFDCERRHATYMLRRFSTEKIEGLINELDTAISDTCDNIPSIDLDNSIYPGEYKGYTPPSRDPTTYVLDHLLPNALAERSSRKLIRVHKIRELVLKLEPEELVALLVLYSEYRSSREGISRAYDVLFNKMQPYRKLIASFKHAASGGLAKKTSPTQSALTVRNQKIKKRAKELSEKGMAKRNLASRLAKEFEPSPRQIRNILKKAEAC